MKFDIENTNPDVVAGELLEFLANKADEHNTATSFEYDMFIAATIAETVKKNTSMLSLRWKFWDDVCKELAEIDKAGNEPTHG